MGSIPPNAALNGRELSSQCSIFTLGQSEHHQLTYQLAVAHQNGLTFIWSNPTVTGTQLERKRGPERPGEREDP